MDHVAIMKKSWDLTQKILSGQKKIESRWYKLKCAPWGKIGRGNMVYFKDSGKPVSIKANVEKIISFSDLTPKKVSQILGSHLGIWNPLAFRRKLQYSTMHEAYSQNNPCQV